MNKKRSTGSGTPRPWDSGARTIPDPPRAAEILLRWLQRVRPPEATPGVDLDAMSEGQLERLHSGLVRLASMDETVLAALVEQVLAGDGLFSSS